MVRSSRCKWCEIPGDQDYNELKLIVEITMKLSRELFGYLMKTRAKLGLEKTCSLFRPKEALSS